MLEVLRLGFTFKRSLDRLIEPSCQEDAAVRGREQIVFPLLHVLSSSEAHVQLDRLGLVAGRHQAVERGQE